VDYQPGPISEFDKLMTMASAAEALGLPYHTVQRAAARKLIPTYRLGDSKKYVRLRDILNRIEHPAP
jgi:excisionase family DNA binding protein